MPIVTITAEAEQAIRSRALNPIAKGSATRNADGTFNTFLESDTIERLVEASFPGESLSDTIIRVCATYGKEGWQ